MHSLPPEPVLPVVAEVLEDDDELLDAAEDELTEELDALEEAVELEALAPPLSLPPVPLLEADDEEAAMPPCPVPPEPPLFCDPRRLGS